MIGRARNMSNARIIGKPAVELDAFVQAFTRIRLLISWHPPCYHAEGVPRFEP